MDEKAKKHVLRLIPYGLYVLTARTADGLNAATVSWLIQASFDPPRIVVGLRKESGIWQRVQTAGTFAVNVLGTGQKEAASAFLRHVEPEEGTLAGHPYHEGATGAPILDGAPAFLECRVVASLDAGDHTLFLADVIEAGVGGEGEALTLADTGWHYGG
ncbi:MAG TPA: flavin reductase family protein [Anaerolineae bacterium]|nr:flavin reductase family protein [Anaerolineae bacterium]